MNVENKKVAFVINPAAGVKKKINTIELIKSYFAEGFDYDFIVWKNKNDFESVKQQILSGNYKTVVACGGDGTVNLVASVIAHSSVALGILPLGSGNGLARSNGISMNLKKALKTIANGKVQLIDGALLNGVPFFCTAGVGFDALIAGRFAASTKRGFITYFKTSFSEYFSYKPNSYKITVDGIVTETKAFLITVANAGQWGNDVYIAPQADLKDGILHVSILKPFLNISIPGIAVKLFAKKINTSSHLMSFNGKEICIEYEGSLPVHFDGEPLNIENKLEIKITPACLNIVC